jgi:hypothetical protein
VIPAPRNCAEEVARRERPRQLNQGPSSPRCARRRATSSAQFLGAGITGVGAVEVLWAVFSGLWLMMIG